MWRMERKTVFSLSLVYLGFFLIHSLDGREPRQAFFLLVAFLLTGGMRIVGETLYMYRLGLLISYENFSLDIHLILFILPSHPCDRYSSCDKNRECIDTIQHYLKCIILHCVESFLFSLLIITLITIITLCN
jgi:hypothetical protein